MKQLKKILSLMLILIMCFSVVPMTELGIEAEAASGVQAKLDAIKSVYPAGSYFTVSGGLYAYDKGTGCQLSNIPARGGLSSGAAAKNVMGEAWSCCGFARYVFYNIFGTGSMSQVSLSNAKIGDYVVFNGHYGIYLSHDSTYVYVYDSNFTTSSTNRVGYNTRVPISRFSAVYRASNYDEINGSSTPTDTTKPTISKVYIEPPKSTSYRACCTCSDNVGVAYVKVATWTTKDQSDLVWRDGIDNSQGTWFVDVYYSEHAKDAKYYYNHFYVYDAAGNCTFSIYDYVDTEAPVISNVKITNYSDSYLITCNVSDNIGITSVSFPTWTHSNGQDDLIWHEGTLNGNIASCRIYKSNHKNESGKYETDIYAYDALGNSGKSVNTTYIANTTVKFNANGGSTSTTSKTVTYGNTYGTLPTPTKSGYNFNGWYTASSGGSKVTSSTSVTATSDHTLYAQWTCTHSSTEVRNAKSATCTATGYTGDTYCKTCGTKTKTGTTISKTSHNSNTTIPAVDATCTSTGLTEGKKCSVCGTVTVAQQTVAKKSHSYTATVTTQPTCTKDGVRTYKCSCGTTYTEAIAKTGHNSNTTIPAVAATCTKSGLTEGKKCSVCGTVTLAQQTIAAKGHTDGNGDYKCDYNCGYEYEKPAEPEVPSDPSENCSCNCHKGGIAGFFFRIINFFQKLFGMNKICECGAKH